MYEYAVVGLVVGLILVILFMFCLYIWMDNERKKYMTQQERMINNLADVMADIRKTKKIKGDE